jgi:AcrR family transcriptional regulator
MSGFALPVNETDDTRHRIMAAAVRCVLRFGVSKTGLADIAAEAGCSRQTVYNHFPNAEAVISAALTEASGAFADRMIAHVRPYRSAAERIVETMMFCLERLPHEPFLRLVADPELGKLVSESLFTSEASRAVIDRVVAVCLEDAPELSPRRAELAEVMTRLTLSFLVIREDEARAPAEMRAFLRRWLLPGLVASDAGPRPVAARPRGKRGAGAARRRARGKRSA